MSTLKLFDRDGERGRREKSFRIVLGKLPLAVGEKRHTRAGVRKCGKQCVMRTPLNCPEARLTADTRVRRR